MKRIIRQGSMEVLCDFPLMVNWVLTRMCNYACDYCFRQEKIDNSAFSSEEQIVKALDNIFGINRSRYAFTLVGGEPTIHPCFWVIMDHLKEMNPRINYVNIITNGSQKSDWYGKLISYTEYMDVNLIISIHLQYASIEHIEEIIKAVSKEVSVQLNLMLEIDRFDEVVDFYTKIQELRKKYPFNVSIDLLRNGKNFDSVDDRYTEEMLEWRETANRKFAEIKRDSNFVVKRKKRNYISKFVDYVEDGSRVFDNDYERNRWLLDGKLSFNGMYCVSGESVLRIEPDGNCRGMVCGASKKKINIFDDDPFSQDDWIHLVKCPKSNCGCSSDHIISKFENEEEANAYVEIIREKQSCMMKRG